MKNFILNLLADERGSISSKRVIGILGALCLFVGFFVKIPQNDHLADLIAGVVAVSLGLTTWDKFSIK
jgi:hypothetical protein